jgi:hypothetical protein
LHTFARILHAIALRLTPVLTETTGVAILLKPFAKVAFGTKSAQFYHSDCLEVFRQLPPHSVDVIVTSPPYNLGIAYGEYEDRLSAEEYLQWTSTWVAAAAQALRPDGSLFLNVGAKPSDPWTALDVAQAARPHLRLQNLIHWVKSIAIERSSAGAAAGLTRDLAVGHYKPINSERFLNDCHEFIFHFTPHGSTTLDRLALGVPYQDQSNIARWQAAADGLRCRGNTWFIPVRNHPAARSRSAASGDVSLAAARAVSAPARTEARRAGHGSVYRAGQHGCRLRAVGAEFRGRGYRRGLFERGSFADANGGSDQDVESGTQVSDNAASRPSGIASISEFRFQISDCRLQSI